MADIDLKKATEEEDETFKVSHIVEEPAEITEQVANPKEKVSVKFSKFVQLVATHKFEDVVSRNEDEDVIVNANLLADLASSHEEQEERRIPVIFAIGLIVGIILTYILFKF